MKKIFTLCAFVTLLFPAVAFAHAVPVETLPISGARLEAAPEHISIRFSEHLEEGSSRISVKSTDGALLSEGDATVQSDGYTLSIPVRTNTGIYVVWWSVVSRDDGHFTRGSYAFSVGTNAALPATNEEVVQIATTKEATYMFVEFVGNSLLWGLIVLYLLVRSDRTRRVFVLLAIIAGLCGVTGAALQILLKTNQLAGLHEVGFFEALRLYMHTVAGFSTTIRGVALGVAALCAALFGFRSARATIITIGIPLLVFAFFRAIVSHATANPFFPLLSIAVNFVHVIEKDLWLGVLLVLCVLFVTRGREHVVPEVLPKALSFLSANLAILTLTAGYIIWLHLKSFSNITTTNWGAAFIPLVVSAIFLVALQVYHVCALRLRPHLAKEYLVPTIAAQTAAAALVVFFTSVVIITSPPPHTALNSFVQNDGEVRATLSRAPYEDGMALLVIEGTHTKPTVTIGARDGGLLPALEKRFEGGYVFPAALITESETQLNVTVSRTRGYDAQFAFDVKADDFTEPIGHGRSFDVFTVVMIILSLCGVALSMFLTVLSRSLSIAIDLRLAAGRAFVGACLSMLVILLCVGGAGIVFKNQYAARCVTDGNMWHLMQPTKAGVALAGQTREGCMWGMGQYEYMFADEREYEYLSSLGTADVTLETVPARIRANAPTNLTFSLKNADGTPATLLIDMEKYVHVVIVSKDESVFAHIHPDDNRSLKQYEIENSTFSVEYTFPKAGEYLVSVDYAHGTQLESKQFRVQVEGAQLQSETVYTFTSPGSFDGYDVSMDYNGARAGEVTTLQFAVSKGGEPVTNLQPYLSAVSHISVVKNDLTAFVHTHGEVHALGAPIVPLTVRDGKIIHSMAAMEAPSHFGPKFDAHVLFPSAGRYTVWAQINVGDKVIPASFTVDVE